MADCDPVQRLREHRSLLLAAEAIGWLHMLGKARADFLRRHGGQKTDYDDRLWHEYESPPFPVDDLLKLLNDRYAAAGGNPVGWPGTITDFLTKHRDSKGTGLLGLLQAAHGMASGIEKNLPNASSAYLGQDATHLWLASAFGRPVRNLLADPPELLSDPGWQRLLGEARRTLEQLRELATATSPAAVETWREWRESAIGSGDTLRAALSSTIAETRLPNNDVTLWDQSYVASALFKSAVAGAIIEGKCFPWNRGDLKQTTRWRLLTVGIGTDHYEARAVRIGDWTGARAALDAFFDRVCQTVEVDLAIGSLLYRDTGLRVFSFPGERSDGTSVALNLGEWQQWLKGKIEELAKGLDLDTPPFYQVSNPTRSLVPLVKETREVRAELAVPVSRPWDITGGTESGHVCPVCLARHNGNTKDKQQPCTICAERRRGRLDAWLGGRLGSDTIWIGEVADANDRAALITLSLDLEPWLEGTHLDSLRTQAISEWRKFNPMLLSQANPIDASQPFTCLTAYVQRKLGDYDDQDPVLRSLQDGYRHEKDWQPFYEKIVEDRSDAPSWDKLSDEQRAGWIVHQLFAKLPSPGRVYRFWRQAEEFFTELLVEFREIASRDPNRWRVRRLTLVPDQTAATADWKDGEVYDGRLGDAPVSLFYRQNSQTFVTSCNLARLLRPEQAADALKDRELALQSDDRISRTLHVQGVKDAGVLGAYHPVIPLELSPLRFRLLVPLEAASACLDHAVETWEKQFARVWDRLPLRAGLIAFPQKLPFQAVIEAARNLEDALDDGRAETWRITARDERAGVLALTFRRADGGTELRTIPVTLPDGRTDVFYPYLAVEDRYVRFPRDFQHPNGPVYRHTLDLRPGDGIGVQPARVATVFLNSTGQRFDPIEPRPLAEWRRMREVWRLIQRTAPSLSALRGAWAELVQYRGAWQSPDGGWTPGGRAAWSDLARAVLLDRLAASGATLDTLVEAADDGTLAWAIEWHLTALKERNAEVIHG